MTALFLCVVFFDCLYVVYVLCIFFGQLYVLICFCGCLGVKLGLYHIYLFILSSDTHTHPFNGPSSGTTQVSRYQKGKTNLKQETVSGSGISWAICKSAPRSRQITMPAPHNSSFFTGRMPFLPPNQQCQCTEGKRAMIVMIIMEHTPT